MILEGLMKSFKENIEVEKKWLLEMHQEIEEDHERKKNVNFKLCKKMLTTKEKTWKL
ncbi:hypothetical protein HanRHA438_Chr14g0645451 [Helianthus annuus]|uniref:Uncharacterized protein n=1 Tax=Helianthus annuus TaxID=4232 RepID=A0A9K3E792_HELAN|nr:hypothetical protein HanXRQr2_Chr14g0634811 [Helianthus annuus]KAJ0485070.1 hypothetical protein HanHA89_Chr14g0564011 [Helianthus annuus]KAJ0655620.1 hypothetical protein HanLR1_Chr14g0526351 [Helianthus annuus]KAJ0659307.1 hypothetical protein HanOQP8_Chr14g0524591 [Helianthus annuus]KAJ0839604.1 hypothetical protein HanPSC8_Chr14g0608831 [Helianthus annuus]